MVKALEKELRTIHHAQLGLGYHKLDKPIRNGWFRTFKLRADIQRNKNSKIYAEVLQAVMIEVWGREKKYADRNWKRYFSKESSWYLRPGIKYLTEEEFSKLSFRAKKCFTMERERMYYGYRKRYACSLPTYYFQSSYRRAYITRFKIESSQLRKREKEIMEILARSELRKYFRYCRGGYRVDLKMHKGRRRKIKMTLAQRDTDYIENEPI